MKKNLLRKKNEKKNFIIDAWCTIKQLYICIIKKYIISNCIFLKSKFFWCASLAGISHDIGPDLMVYKIKDVPLRLSVEKKTNYF